MREPRAGAVLTPNDWAEEIRGGMSRPQKELPPKLFYDGRGSELFEEITRLPEYYLTRAERTLLERSVAGWIGGAGFRTLVELGAGSAEKTRLLLDAITAGETPATYMPVDVSLSSLGAAAPRLRGEYPRLRVRPAMVDISREFTLPTDLARPTLFAFLGSTIGNFTPEAAVRLLRTVRAAMHPGDRLFLGVDLRKQRDVLERAYNDSRGVTAEFNRNVLRVLNRDFGADFDLAAWDHRAFYDVVEHRIEMHLVARREQRVTIPGLGSWEIAAGETIRTELSYKYDRASVERLLNAAGLALNSWEADAPGWYAILLARAVQAPEVAA